MVWLIWKIPIWLIHEEGEIVKGKEKEYEEEKKKKKKRRKEEKKKEEKE